MRENDTLSSGYGGKKARQLQLFVAALLSHASVEDAARASGISPSTAWRWMRDPAVLARLREARRDAMNAAMTRLQEAAVGAVDCLCEVQRTGESESARVSAARTILEQALRAVELGDIQERLEKLEVLTKNSNWRRGTNEQADSPQARAAGGVNDAAGG
jgi:hypothetical protein